MEEISPPFIRFSLNFYKSLHFSTDVIYFHYDMYENLFWDLVSEWVDFNLILALIKYLIIASKLKVYLIIKIDYGCIYFISDTKIYY